VRTDSRRYPVSLAIIVLGAAFAAAACGSDSPTTPTTLATTTNTTTTSSTTTTADPPTVSAISPATGGDIGGTAVTITGTNFASGATVLIGGVAATSVVVVSDTTITAKTAIHDAGAVDVQVTVSTQSGKLEGGFTYLGPVDTVMTFTVYNHTAGRLGQWTAARQSGTSVTLLIDALGEVVDDDGNTVQPPIAVDSADGKRFVLRTGATGGRTGDLVAASTTGQITFTVPYVAKQAYDVFVMNALNGADYSLLAGSYLTYSRAVTVSRGADTGGATGPDSLVDTFAREFDRALALPWMRYGQVTRTGANGEIFVTYTAPNAGACISYTRAKGMLYINPDVCSAASVDLEALALENGFEMFVGLRDIFGADSSAAIDQGTRQLTPIGRDLLTYVFLKDAKSW
jgi:hypothetical protein